MTVDVTFDETNDSQVEKVYQNVVRLGDPPGEATKQLAICDVRQVESQDEEERPQVIASTSLQGLATNPQSPRTVESPSQTMEASCSNTEVPRSGKLINLKSM